MTESEIKNRLRHWIVERCGKITLEEIHDDTPIIEQRIVSSLHALELLCYIEQMRERPLETSELKPFMLRSIDAIYTVFFAPAA
jgi:acyl carrier protein